MEVKDCFFLLVFRDYFCFEKILVFCLKVRGVLKRFFYCFNVGFFDCLLILFFSGVLFLLTLYIEGLLFKGGSYY